MATSPSSLPQPFELHLPERGESLRVSSFAGREEVSRPFRLRVAAALPGGDVALAEELLGARATLTIHEGIEVARRIHGIIAAASFGEVIEGEQRVIHLRIAPRLWRLSRRRTRRIFQDKTTIAIAEAILGEWSLPMRSAIQRELFRRAYCVQYDETDLAFLSRLFAEEGIFYAFEHAEDAREGDVLWLADGPEDATPIDGDARLAFLRNAAGAGSRTAADGITAIRPGARVRTGRARVQGYDFRRPQAPLDDDAATRPKPASPETIDEDEGSYEDDLELRPAIVRLEQERARAFYAIAETTCRRLAPLRRFRLDDYGAFGLSGELTVVRIDHEGYGGDVIPAGRAQYQNRIRTIRAEVAPRPRWSPPRPRQVTESATVVGPPGAEIHSDEHGRIKVQFHWDREGKGDDTSSCWLRVATPWAGAGWGVQFLPRVGMEVLVAFLGGDVDRPVCAGALYNATHVIPFPYPEDGARNGIRTHSTPDSEGYNEISFNDRAESEQIFVRAQRDLDETVGRNRTSRVTGARLDDIGDSATARVARDARAEVGRDRVTEIGGDETLLVGGARETHVAGDEALEVDGGAHARISGDAAVEIRGRSTHVVGSEEKPSNREDYVFGAAALGAQEQLVLRSETSLLLHVGDAMIHLKPDKIVLKAPTIEIAATKALECKAKDGPTVTLGEDLEVLSKKVRVFTEGAAMELDKEAKINGAKIKLGYNPSKPEKKDDEEEPETQSFSCRLTDYYLEPYANRKYHLVAEGLRFEGETDGDGAIKQDVPKSARSVSIRLWLDGYPEGRQRLYSFRVGDIPPSTDVRGAKIRLRNLGYYRGPLDAQPNEDLATAVAEFQGDHKDTHGLEPTGELDEGTMGALEEVHGH